MDYNSLYESQLIRGQVSGFWPEGGVGIPFLSNLNFDWRDDSRVDNQATSTDATGNELLDIIGGNAAIFDQATSSVALNNIDDSYNNLIFKTTIITGSDTSTGQTIAGHLSFSTLPTAHWAVSISANKINYEIVAGGVRKNRSHPTILTANTKYELLFFIDATNGLLYMYIDGVQDTPLAFTGAPDKTSIPLCLGSAFNGRFFGGTQFSASFTDTILTPSTFNDTIAAITDNIDYIPLNGNTYGSETGTKYVFTNPSYALLRYNTPDSTQRGLDRGYTLRGTEQIIYNSAGVKVITTLGGDIERQGGVFHNLIDSYFSLNPTGDAGAKHDIWDRRNATIQSVTSRDSIYYDDSDRITASQYHVSEINAYTFATFYNVGYKGKPYPNATINSIDQREKITGLFSYNTDKKSLDEVKIYKYTNDITKAIDDGSGGYLEDVDGYVILTL
jgi:hypothetical protein